MSKEIKEQIKADYAKIVAQNEKWGSEAQRRYICKPIFDPIATAYPKFKGYISEADLGLGCGFPFEYAGIQEGSTVLDLGCAAGVDSFIARKMVGDDGKVIGYDLTPELIVRAQSIAKKENIVNAKFEVADITHLPLEAEKADVAISNGVFSLLPDTRNSFVEVYRVLKPGGVFCISDINRKHMFPTDTYDRIKKFTGCLNGIRLHDYYIGAMKSAGFQNVEVVSERSVSMPSEVSEGDGIYISTFLMRKQKN